MDELLGEDYSVFHGGNKNWRDITIEKFPGTVIGGHIRFRKCHFCGADAGYLIIRTSMLTDNTYTDPACYRHASGWMPSTGETV